MYNQPSRVRYAYGGVRVSSKEQGLKDSPQAQMEQINRYAEHNNIVIIDFIKFYESGSKKDQPMQRAIEFGLLSFDSPFQQLQNCIFFYTKRKLFTRHTPRHIVFWALV